ncbi:MAG TPA: AAA family ATPase [Hyphomicrobium sp.]|mgnify:CR=1 FL=1|nr:AAA family ATPase [Hyphomicrobium sp.]
MFFKRRNKEKPAEAAEAPVAAMTETASAAGAGGAPPESDGISADSLRRGVDAASLGFKTTADLEPEDGPFGQDRALADLDFGLKMPGRDFNIFVLGPPGSGTRASVCAHLEKKQRSAETPPDWIYVPSFDDPHRLRALRLPAGRAALFSERIDTAVAELRATLPAAFEAEDYRARHRAIEEDYRSAHDDALDALHAKAAEQNIAVLRTPLGFGMAPMHDGQVVKPEVFNQLPQVMRRDVESRVGALQSELEAILTSAPAVDKERRRQLAVLNVETARHPIEAALDGLSQDFADVPDATAFLAEMERDLIANAQAFLSTTQDSGLRRYAAHVVVARANDAGAPLVSETDPTPLGLTGSIGSAADGAPAASATRRIRAGVLHQTNGGVLVIDARCLIAAPETWKALKTALKTREIRLFSPSSCASAVADAIPFDAKVILIGTPDDYTQLDAADADFALLFKVQVCFEPAIARSAVNDNRFARLIASVVATHALKPLDAGGVARLIEEASRLAGHRDKVTLDVERIADIAREVDVWSQHSGRDVTTAEDVARAMTERAQRADRVRERTRSRQASASLLGETAGGRAGHIIALSARDAGGIRLGAVHRVVARAHPGRGRSAEIVHAGATDARHAPILRSYLAGTFAQTFPLALGAMLTIDPPSDNVAVQGGAPLAEVLALVSALADEPLRQDLAVTGTIDAGGEVQAVDGINEHIEAFFDACQAHALSGTPGVLIPDGNRPHLMLRQDVVDAVRDGRFVLHAIKTVDDALALMTARDTGLRGADGHFAPDTLNGRAEAKLRAFAEIQRAFGRGVDTVAGVREGRT